MILTFYAIKICVFEFFTSKFLKWSRNQKKRLKLDWFIERNITLELFLAFFNFKITFQVKKIFKSPKLGISFQSFSQKFC